MTLPCLHGSSLRSSSAPSGPEDPSKIKYQADSPDESALVIAAKVFGFFFHRRSTTTIMVQESVGDSVTELEYEILNVLEFDSTRKRMSVICRTPDNRILLYCKVRGGVCAALRLLCVERRVHACWPEHALTLALSSMRWALADAAGTCSLCRWRALPACMSHAGTVLAIDNPR